MSFPLLAVLLAVSAPADAPAALPDSLQTGPRLRPPAEVEFVAPRRPAASARPPWRDAPWWPAGNAWRVDIPWPAADVAAPDSLALWLALCGREADPHDAWRMDAATGRRQRWARLQASWLPVAVRRLLVLEARAGTYRRIKAREAELYDEFLATEIPVTPTRDTDR